MSNKTVLVFGCAVAILLLFPLAARAQTYWNVQSGDWSVASNWSNGLPGSYNDAYVTNGGTVSITQTEGQDGYPIPLCIGLSGGSGSVQMLGGSFAAGWQYVGYSGTGNFTQSGGTNGDAVNGADLCLASSSGSSGTYNLNGSGVLMDAILQVGYGGTGVFTQSGGTNTSGEFGGGQIGIVLGCSSGGSGTYHLSGSGYLSVVQDEFVGYNAGSTGLFQQSGGVNTTGGLIIGSGGRYVLSGGTLQLSGNPSAFVNVGTFDGGNSPATLSAANCTIDLTTGTWQNMGRTSVVMGANSLLLAPAGFNPSTAFASYSSSGITHIAGTPLTVPVGATVYGSFSLNDPVNCQGSISAFFDAGVVQKPAIYLNNGLVLSGSGSVSLGNGSLTVNDTSSGMTGSGSSLAAPNEYVGYGGTGVFTHSAGYNNLIPQSSSLTPGSIYLGYNQGDSGTYRLSGSGAISTSDPGIGYGNEYVGYLGTGNFTQSGGTNQTGTLTLGTTPGSSGTYSLSGTGLLSTTGNSGSGHGNEYVGCSGTGSFTQSGGTNQTGSLTIGSGGRYLLAGGSLQANGFGTGGTTALACSGTFDGGNGPAVLSLGAGCLADFSRGTLVNTGLTQLVMGANSLVVLPAGFAGGFAPSSSLGVVYTLGTTLVVPAGQGFSVPLSVSDPVVCQGSILAPGYPSWTSSPIYLNDGLILSGTGNVNLGTGNLTVNDTASGMSSGSLSASRNYVGYTGTGVFTQSGGTNSTQYLYLGGAPGTAGTYDLNGGTLIVSYITTGAGAAALNFNGGTLKAGGTLSVTMPMTLGTSGGNATVDTGGNTVTLSGVLSGPGSLAKIDSGTLILSAANTYAGSTAVNAGMLSLTGSLNSSSALVLGGGAFSYAPTANGGSGNSQTVAGLTVNVGASSVNASAGNPLALGPITRNPGGTVGFNTNTTGTITTSQTNTNGILGPWATYGSGTSTSYATATGSGAPYAIAAYTGATPITSGVTGLTDTTGTVNYALSSGGGTLTAAVGANTLQFTGAAGTVTVSGTNSLSLNGIMNAGSGTATIAGENLIIGSTRELVFTGPGSVTVGATVQDNGSGPSAVTMAGSGTLVLGTANTYSGNTFISGGTLVLGAANSCSGNTFISGGTLALANSAALQQSTLDTSCSGSLSFGSLGSARLGSLTGPGTLTLNNTASAAVALSVGNNNASTTFSGILQGAGSLTKIGSGTFILSGSNTYSGGTTVSAGTLQVGDGTANNGCIQGNILDNARMAFANAAAQTYAGAIAGTGCLIMAGPGTLTLSGSNTYTGGTTVFAGTLQLGDGTANNGYVQGNITDSAVLAFANPLAETYSGIISGTGALAKGAGGALTLSGPDTYQGGTTLSAGTLILANTTAAGTGPFTLTGGALSSTNQYVGSPGMGIFTHSGGTNSVSGSLYLDSASGASGVYNLCGSGLLSVGGTGFVGCSGTGNFTQSGGTNAPSSLCLGYSSGSSGTYNLSGTGQLSAGSEYVGYDPGATALFQQTGGTNTATYLSIGNGGRYLLSGGTLQITGGFSNQGVLDGSGGGTLLLSSANCLVDLTQGAFQNVKSVSVNLGINSLLIIPTGFDTSVFGSFTNSGLTHTAGTTLTLAAGEGFGGSGSINDPVNCQGTITASPGGFINLNNGLTLSGAGAVSLGSGSLVVNDSTSGITSGSLSESNQYIGNGGTGLFMQSGGTNTVGGSLVLASSSGGSGTYSLSGGTLSVSQIVQGAGSAAFDFGGGVLRANAPLSISLPINLTGNGGSATVDTNGQNVTLSGVLSGPGGLIKANSGTLTLAASNTFSGNTLISGGSLALANSAALQQSTLDTSGSGSLSFGSLGSAALGGLAGPGTLTLTNGASAAVALSVGNNNASTTFSGSLQGAGSLAEAGNGTLTLSGSNTYTGGTTVFAGTLQLGDGTANNGYVQGNITDSAVLAFANPLAQTYSGIISGTGALAKGAGGALTLSGPDTYQGGTTLSAGTLILANTAAAGTGLFTLTGGALSSTNQYVGSPGMGNFTQTGGTNNVSNALYLGSASGASGTYNLSGTGLLSVTHWEYIGSSGTGTFAQSGGTNALNGTLVLGNSSGGIGTYNLSGTGTLSAAGGFVGNFGTGSFTQSGGTNTISQILYLGYSSGGSGTYNLNGGVLCLPQLIQGAGSATFNFGGGVLQAKAPLSTTLPMILTGGGNATIDTNGQTVALWGVLSGPGNLVKADTGTLTLAASNTYSGNTLISGGTLALGNSAALQQSTLDTSGGGSLSFGSLGSATLGGLTGPGTITLANTASTAVALSVGNNNNSTTFSGTLQGAGSLAKVGTGTLTVTGNNTYSGGTSISAGGLVVAGSLGNTAVTVGGGATLGGTGSIAGTVVVLGGNTAGTQGAVNLADGMPGTLTLSDPNPADTVLTLGGLTVGNPSAFTFEVGTIADRIQVAAGKVVVNPGGSLINIIALSGFGPGTYDLLDFPGGQASGLGYLSLATTSVNGYPIYLQSTPTAEQLVVAVPEPSTLALLASGAVGILGFARPWRKRARRRVPAPASPDSRPTTGGR